VFRRRAGDIHAPLARRCREILFVELGDTPKPPASLTLGDWRARCVAGWRATSTHYEFRGSDAADARSDRGAPFDASPIIMVRVSTICGARRA
jgi:hypothetical protein